MVMVQPLGRLVYYLEWIVGGLEIIELKYFGVHPVWLK